MESHPYWQKQQSSAPLFPDIEWSRPEQRGMSGKLGVIGGSKLGFASVGEAYSAATDAGVGAIHAVLPDALKRAVPPTIPGVLFAASNPSGGLARGALNELNALGEWAQGIILIGDAGGNSETAIVYDDFIRNYSGQLTITRDTFDLIKQTLDTTVEREHTLFVLSFAQLQTLFRSVYYPKMLTFSMQLQQLVEALHKFTITYPVTITTFHQQQLIVAHGGQVVTTEWGNPMAIWRGSVAARAASYWLWSPSKPLEAVVTSFAT